MRKKKISQRKQNSADNKQWVKWLLDYHGQDLDRLTPVQIDKLNSQIDTFSSRASILRKKTHGITVIPNLDSSWKPGDTFQHAFHKPLNLNQIKNIQKKLRVGFSLLLPEEIEKTDTGLITGNDWIIPVSISEIRLTRHGLVFDPKGKYVKSRQFQIDRSTLGRIERSYSADWENLFWLAVSDLIFDFGPSIRRCRECGTIFLKRKQQQYCSQKCSQRVRSRKWYESHGLQKRLEALQAKMEKIRTKISKGKGTNTQTKLGTVG